MGGEFLSLYESIDFKNSKKVSLKAFQIYIAKKFLDNFKGLKISKKRYARELAIFLLEKGLKEYEILSITKLSRTTLWRLKNEKK